MNHATIIQNVSVRCSDGTIAIPRSQAIMLPLLRDILADLDVAHNVAHDDAVVIPAESTIRGLYTALSYDNRPFTLAEQPNLMYWQVINVDDIPIDRYMSDHMRMIREKINRIESEKFYERLFGSCAHHCEMCEEMIRSRTHAQPNGKYIKYCEHHTCSEIGCVRAKYHRGDHLCIKPKTVNNADKLSIFT